MKYSIRIFGYGAEVAFGYIDKETKEKLIDALDDAQKLSDAVQDSDVIGVDWREVSDVYRNFHANDEFQYLIRSVKIAICTSEEPTSLACSFKSLKTLSLFKIFFVIF